MNTQLPSSSTRRLPVALGLTAILAAAIVWALGWASTLEATCFAAALVAVAAVGALAERRTARVLGAEIERRKEAEQTARAANRAKSEFLANMSHELRTPLGTVIGTADLLLAAELPAETRRHVEVIDVSAKALLALIDDVFDFAKLEAGRLRLDETDFYLRDVVARVRDLTAPRAAEKGLELGFDVAAELPEALRGDPARLRQVLVNLVGNAIKFTPSGRVVVRVERVAAGDDEPRVRFTVRDTGIGISPEAQKRIFETFYQADSSAARRAGGSGLGLAICKELVTRMGGEIDFESEHGKGTTFRFAVPLVLARGEVPDSREMPVPAMARDFDRGRYRILVVEDGRTGRDLALAHLAALGYRAEASADGTTALARLAEERFDAVLMDCQMPELDGYETTRRLRRAERERGETRTPVIALTAHALPGEREKCLAVGMDDYLTKPYRGAELGAVLDRWLGTGAAGTGAASTGAASTGEPGTGEDGTGEDGTSAASTGEPGTVAAGTGEPGTGAASTGEPGTGEPGTASESGTGSRSATARERVAERLDALRRLGERTGEDVLGAAIANYRREGAELLAVMRRALRASDAAALAKAAHTLAGTAGTLGAMALTEASREIEARAMGGELDGLDRLLSSAEDAHARFEALLPAPSPLEERDARRANGDLPTR